MHHDAPRTGSRRATTALTAVCALGLATMAPMAWAAVVPPTASVTAESDVRIVYEWDVAKRAERTDLGTVDAGAELTARYSVTATPKDYRYERARIAGTATLRNPGTTDEVRATVSAKASDAAWACDVGTPEHTLEPGGTADVSYDCILSGDAEPETSGSVAVSVDWTSGGESGTVQAERAYDLAADEVHRGVDVLDAFDGGSPRTLGRATWNLDGTPVTFDDVRTFRAAPEAGRHEVTNVASIGGTKQQASATVTYTVRGAKGPEGDPSPAPSPTPSPTPPETPSQSPTPAPGPSESETPDDTPTADAPRTEAPTTSAPWSPGNKPRAGLPPTGVH